MENEVTQEKETVFSDALFKRTKDLTEEELETVEQFHPTGTRFGVAKLHLAMPNCQTK